jgi:hypothetical protein
MARTKAKPETPKQKWDRMKAENHEAQAKRAAANARTRELLKLGANAPIPKGFTNGETPTHNRASRRDAGQIRSIGHGRRRRAATRMVMPGFEPPWKRGDGSTT